MHALLGQSTNFAARLWHVICGGGSTLLQKSCTQPVNVRGFKSQDAYTPQSTHWVVQRYCALGVLRPERLFFKH